MPAMSAVTVPKMTVMRIRGLRLAVAQWLMLMAMTITMRTAWRIIGVMVILMVLNVLVRVLIYFRRV